MCQSLKMIITMLSIVVLLSAETILKPGVISPTFSMLSLEGKRESLRIWCGDKLSKPYVNNDKHIVIISFWATFCQPCKKEIPELQAFYEKHKSEKLKIFLISLDTDGAKVVAPIVKKNNYTLPILLDPYKGIAKRYGVKSLPSIFMIDGNGIIRYSSTGYRKNIDFAKVLERAYSATKKGQNYGGRADGGNVVNIPVYVNHSVTSKKKVLPKTRWKAVAKIECGSRPIDVAKEFNVSIEDLKKWYKELREMALDLWGK